MGRKRQRKENKREEEPLQQPPKTIKKEKVEEGSEEETKPPQTLLNQIKKEVKEEEFTKPSPKKGLQRKRPNSIRDAVMSIPFTKKTKPKRKISAEELARNAALEAAESTDDDDC